MESSTLCEQFYFCHDHHRMTIGYLEASFCDQDGILKYATWYSPLKLVDKDVTVDALGKIENIVSYIVLESIDEEAMGEVAVPHYHSIGNNWLECHNGGSYNFPTALSDPMFDSLFLTASDI
jgi:hypothetical protein